MTKTTADLLMEAVDLAGTQGGFAAIDFLTQHQVSIEAVLAAVASPELVVIRELINSQIDGCRAAEG